MKKNCLLWLIILCIFLCSACQTTTNVSDTKYSSSNNSINRNNYYNIEYKDGEYTYEIYNIKGDIIDKGSSIRQPHVKVYDNYVIGILFQMGTGPSTKIGWFYDVDSNFKSKTYDFVFDYFNGLVAYCGSDNKIIIQKVFGDEEVVLCIEEEKLKNKATDVIDYILGAEFISSNTLRVEYISKEHEIISCEFSIKETKRIQGDKGTVLSSPSFEHR